jgi:hypothetical protein
MKAGPTSVVPGFAYLRVCENRSVRYSPPDGAMAALVGGPT